MSVHTNISEVLKAIGSNDARFAAIELPQGFNEWSRAVEQLKEDNPAFFDMWGAVDCTDPRVTVGALWGAGRGFIGYMLITDRSRYVITNWAQRLTQVYQPSALPGVLGAAIRTANYKAGRK